MGPGGSFDVGQMSLSCGFSNSVITYTAMKIPSLIKRLLKRSLSPKTLELMPAGHLSLAFQRICVLPASLTCWIYRLGRPSPTARAIGFDEMTKKGKGKKYQNEKKKLAFYLYITKSHASYYIDEMMVLRKHDFFAVDRVRFFCSHFLQ